VRVPFSKSTPLITEKPLDPEDPDRGIAISWRETVLSEIHRDSNPVPCIDVGNSLTIKNTRLREYAGEETANERKQADYVSRMIVYGDARGESTIGMRVAFRKVQRRGTDAD